MTRIPADYSKPRMRNGRGWKICLVGPAFGRVGQYCPPTRKQTMNVLTGINQHLYCCHFYLNTRKVRDRNNLHRHTVGLQVAQLVEKVKMENVTKPVPPVCKRQRFSGPPAVARAYVNLCLLLTAIGSSCSQTDPG